MISVPFAVTPSKVSSSTLTLSLDSSATSEMLSTSSKNTTLGWYSLAVCMT